MELSLRKQNLIRFIYERFDKYEFDRSKAYVGDVTKYFPTYEAFMNFQTQTIDQFSEKDIDAIEYLINLLPMLQLMDKESMIPWPASGFVFAPDLTIVLFHER